MSGTSKEERVYRDLEQDLIAMRLLHNGLECPEEEELLDRMHDAWFTLSHDEKDAINAEGPKTLISAYPVKSPSDSSLVDQARVLERIEASRRTQEALCDSDLLLLKCVLEGVSASDWKVAVARHAAGSHTTHPINLDAWYGRIAALDAYIADKNAMVAAERERRASKDGVPVGER